MRCALLLAVALVLLIGSMVLFVVADSVGLLIAARALQGLATGAAIGTLTAAMGIARTTTDTARIFGSLTGAGLFAAIGIGLFDYHAALARARLNRESLP